MRFPSEFRVISSGYHLITHIILRVIIVILSDRTWGGSRFRPSPDFGPNPEIGPNLEIQQGTDNQSIRIESLHPRVLENWEEVRRILMGFDITLSPGFILILNVDLHMTTTVGIDITKNVGLNMTKNMGLNMTTNVGIGLILTRRHEISIRIS